MPGRKQKPRRRPVPARAAPAGAQPSTARAAAEAAAAEGPMGAAFPLRALNGVLDGTLVLAVLSLISLIPGARPPAAGSGTTVTAASVLYACGVAAIMGVYQVLTVRLFGQTAAMRGLHLRVITDRDGSRPTLAQAAVRSLPFVLPLPLIAAFPSWGLSWVILVGFCFGGALRHPRRRAYHDRLSATTVIREGRPLSRQRSGAAPSR